MSSFFPNWQNFAVHQRRANSGCIPTGYEMILRSVGASYVDFMTFQDEFDLDKDLLPGDIPKSNFETVAAEVNKNSTKFSLAT